jgi:tripartite-type tricarboxylate transporter receptor subunit TctC
MQKRFSIVAICLLVFTAAVAPARSDQYPEKPIWVISDSAPGSAVDVTFRMVMDRLGKMLGQQIVPVAQPGASGAIAAHAAAEADPDGYTYFAPALSLFISLPGKAPNLPLILPRDFRYAPNFRHIPCNAVSDALGHDRPNAVPQKGEASPRRPIRWF